MQEPAHTRLISAFARARIPFEISETPLCEILDQTHTATYEIVQLGVGHRGSEGSPSSEYLQLYWGKVENEITVLDLDGQTQKLLLQVRETARIITGKTWVPSERCKIRFTHKIGTKPRTYIIKIENGCVVWFCLPDTAAVNSILEAEACLQPPIVTEALIQGKNVQHHSNFFFIPVLPESVTWIPEK